jgi:hypothetical protein
MMLRRQEVPTFQETITKLRNVQFFSPIRRTVLETPKRDKILKERKTT